MNEFFDEKFKSRLKGMTLTVLILLALFLGVKSVSEIQGFRYIGAGMQATNTINVTGKGEVFAAPDIATFTYTVDEKAATVSAAQTSATGKTNAILAFLKDNGVDEKDIQTSGYNVYPEYAYSQVVCTNICPPQRQVLDGYHVAQSVTVKVRDLAKAGDILAGVGSHGATNVSGLSFTLDKQDEVVAEARTKAIADARAKADELAKELGVSLVRVVSFNESGNYPVPIYAYGMGGKADATAASAPAIPAGQNDIVSNVSVTYEIR